jgi:hypothetical protein
LRRIQNEEQLNLPQWQLFSNPIVTGSICFAAFLCFVVTAATFDYAYEASMVLVISHV